MSYSLDFNYVAREYETSLYVFDFDELKNRINTIQEVLGDRIKLCYAIKANAMLLKAADECVEKFEVCSPGEFEVCKKTGIDPSKIVYSGVYKDLKRTPLVLDVIAGRGVATVESLNHLEIINDYANEHKKTVDVLLRITSGNQFGMDKEVVKELIDTREDRPYLNIKGVQLFSGTQKRKIRTIEKELRMLDEFIKEVKADGFEIEELEYGPGLPVNYFQDDEYDEMGMLKEMKEIFDSMEYQGRVIIEAGRYIAASCGYFLTQVVDIKRNKDRNYIITDGGSHQMKYYGQTLGMKIPKYQQLRMSDTEESEGDVYDICGALCSVHDVIVRELHLVSPKIGDVLVFENTGAYSVTEGMSLFLTRDIPMVIAFDKKNGYRVLRERIETADINFAALL